MSTARQADRLNETADIPTVPTRRSILRPARPTRSALQGEGSSFADWRCQAVTEELAAVPATPAVPPTSPRVGRPVRGATVRRHLRAALTGTLLAIVAITGLSSYAAAGIAEARSAALCQAHIACR